MKIVKVSEEVKGLADLVALVRNDRACNLKDAEGVEVIELQAWAVVDDANADDTETRVLAMADSDGVVYNTVSRPFIREFLNLVDMCEAFGGALESVALVHGITQGGQDFMTCKLAGFR